MVQTGGIYILSLPFFLLVNTLLLHHLRITEFTFVVDQNREKPIITFTGEQPYLQYVRTYLSVFQTI